MVRARGQLEHEVMEALWQSPEGLSVRALVDRLDGPPAMTTIFTIVERLEGKGLVSREGTRGSGYVFHATSSREDDIVKTMLVSLTGTDDRHAALLRFAGELDEHDAAILRNALDAKRRRRH